MRMLWQKFTEGAKRVVIAAQEEAAHMGEPYVSPEYLLLGLVKGTDSVASGVLECLGATPSLVRQDLERQLHILRSSRLKNNEVTLDPRLKLVLEFAYDEARQTNTNYIGTEHILLGIIREADGIAFRTLSKHGIDIVVARREVVAYLGGDLSMPPPSVSTSPPPSPSTSPPPSPSTLPPPSPSTLPLQPARTTPASQGSLPRLVTYQVQQFADPDKATAWMNECARAGFRFTHSSAAPTGEIWIIVSASVQPADQSVTLACNLSQAVE